MRRRVTGEEIVPVILGGAHKIGLKGTLVVLDVFEITEAKVIGIRIFSIGNAAQKFIGISKELHLNLSIINSIKKLINSINANSNFTDFTTLLTCNNTLIEVNSIRKTSYNSIFIIGARLCVFLFLAGVRLSLCQLYAPRLKEIIDL
jgi:hypothetical protein